MPLDVAVMRLVRWVPPCVALILAVLCTPPTAAQNGYSTAHDSLVTPPDGAAASSVDATRAADTTSVVSAQPRGDVTSPHRLLQYSSTRRRTAPPASAPVAGGVPFDTYAWTGRADTLVYPVVSHVTDAAHLLMSVPGSFLYDLGTAGWPHGWSPDGLDPNSLALELGGRSLNDYMTGRPRYDLLPMALIEPLKAEPAQAGSPIGVTTRLRDFDASRPHTELRYLKGESGLQAVSAVHSQRRRSSLLGHAGELNVTAGFGGRASSGQYEGSRLRRERQLLARVRFARPAWHVEVVNLHNRREIGAHGGVIPRLPGVLASVYERFGARVENPNAARRTVRNDVSVELGLPLLSARNPTLVAIFWTAQASRFRDPTDTVAVDLDDLGAEIRHTFGAGRWSPELAVTAASRAAAPGWAEPHRNAEVHATLRESVVLRRLQIEVRAGIHRSRDLMPSAALSAVWNGGAWRPFFHASFGPQPEALLWRLGFGDLVQPLAHARTPRTRVARAGLRGQVGPLSLGVTAFANENRGGLYVLPHAADSMVVVLADAPVRKAGTVAELGWRERDVRGLYAAVDATITSTLNASGRPLHPRVADALPKVHGSARSGLRYRLFRGDLDLHAFILARAWTAFRGRALHPPTGLLLLPEREAPVLGPASTISFIIEAGVREATIFLSYENAFAGTPLMDGTMHVPVYPIAEQVLRFGVFWPISD